METLEKLMPVLSGALSVPIVSWVKSKLPTDFPVQQVFMTSLFNIGIVYLMAYLMKLTIPFEQAIGLAALGQVASQYGHGLKKTYQENVIKK